MMSSFVAGLATGLSLIVAIGAQNAFVLRVGLTRRFVALVVTICSLSDAVLIAAGVGGLSSVASKAPHLLTILRWLGVGYLALFALRSLWSAIGSHALVASEGGVSGRRAIVGATLAFTFLNPHVYLDTVVLLGTIGNHFGAHRWYFAAGAATGSVAWFSALGFGARILSPLLSRPVWWKVVDVVVAVVVSGVAYGLATMVI